MTILGIDPGLERIGYAVVRRDGSRLQALDYGLIKTAPENLCDRLGRVHEAMQELLERTRPDAVATERLHFAANRTTAMDVAKALGAILIAVGRSGAPWSEYTPTEVKKAVVGTGAADKAQVRYMVIRLLALSEPPRPDDVADALAIAICHGLRTRVPGLSAR